MLLLSFRIRAQCCQSPSFYLDDAATRRCNGECGAVEEHVMEINGYMILQVKPEDSLSTAGHHPVLAGYSPDGSACFIAYNAVEIPHTVCDGTRSKDLRFRAHYEDGSVKDEDIYAQKHDIMKVFCLRYDPFVYEHTDGASPNSVGMDATGPYSWKFNRKLPVKKNEDEEARCKGEEDYSEEEEEEDSSEADNGYYCDIPVLWREAIYEPKSETSTREQASSREKRGRRRIG